MNGIHTVVNCLKRFHLRSATILLVLLLCADVVFVALHTLYFLLSGMTDPAFNLEQDRGYSEVFQYLKFLWILILLVWLSARERTGNFIGWIALFAYFFVDDALQIHEQVGAHIGSTFAFLPVQGLRPQDYGELAVSAVAGAVLLILLVWTYRRGSRFFKRMSRDMALLIGVLCFFAVFVDMVHVVINLGWEVDFILMVIEDGGELAAVSLIVWYLFFMCVDERDFQYYLWDCVYELAPGKLGKK